MLTPEEMAAIFTEFFPGMKVGDQVVVIQPSAEADYLNRCRGQIIEFTINNKKRFPHRVSVKLNGREGLLDFPKEHLRVLTILDLLAEI